MSDTYPWGSQAPQARLAKLERTLESSERARNKYLDQHKARIAQFDEADRQTKADIRQCQQVIEKERNEANAASVSRLLMKVLGGSNPELVEEALKDGTLEQRLASLTSELEGTAEKSGGKRGAKKSAESAEAPGA